MPRLTEILERDRVTPRATFNNIETALNEVLPGSNFHPRYRKVAEVGLAVMIDRTDRATYNPIINPGLVPMFQADNQDDHPKAWDPLTPDSEFLEGEETALERFVFFERAKAENMRLTGGPYSYDPDRLAITPGRVGFAGGRILYGAYVIPSGLWELHDHWVGGVMAEEIVGVAALGREPRTSGDFAEFFEKGLHRIQGLHEGVAEPSHRAVGDLLPFVDSPFC